MIYVSEKGVRDAGEKVPAELKESIEKKIATLKEVKEKDDADAIKNATQDLSAELQKIGEIMYKDNKETPAAGEPKDAGEEQGTQ